MKKFIKFLGITAALAAVTPYRFDKDEETQELTMQALLWKAAARPNDEGKHDVAVAIGLRHPETADMFSDAEREEGEGYAVTVEVKRDDPETEESRGYAVTMEIKRDDPAEEENE